MLKHGKHILRALLLGSVIVSGSAMAQFTVDKNSLLTSYDFVIDELILRHPAGTNRQICLDNAFKDWRACLKKAGTDAAKQNACHTGFKEYKDWCKSRW